MSFRIRTLTEEAQARSSAAIEAFSFDADRDTLAETYEVLSRDLLMLAVGALLGEGNPRQFFRGLIRCAENGRRLLALMQRRRLDPPPASSNCPLLAAAAAGDWQRCAAIVGATRSTHAKADGEYPEEFLWATVMGDLCTSGSAQPEGWRGKLDELRALDGAGFGGRSEVARALIERDGDGFVESFANERARRERETEKTAARFGTSVTDFGPHRFVWIEGLALLRIAERAGLPWPSGDMRLCPRLALGKPPEDDGQHAVVYIGPDIV